MTAELITIIAATIALGTAMLASIRGVRQEVRHLRTELRTEIRTEVQDLRTEIQDLRTETRTEIQELRTDMNSLENRLRTEMQAGFKELAAQIVNLGDRLSKVEGIIEGMFWSARNQPADKPGEGAA